MGQLEETLGNTKWSDGQPEGLRISQWGMGLEATLGDLCYWMDMEFLHILQDFMELLPCHPLKHCNMPLGNWYMLF